MKEIRTSGSERWEHQRD